MQVAKTRTKQLAFKMHNISTAFVFTTYSSAMPLNKPESSLPPGQQLVAPGKWPIIGERHPSSLQEPWCLSLTGCVANPETFTLEQLRAMPQSNHVLDIHCVTRWSKLGVEFGGVWLKDLLALVEPLDEARFVSFVSRSERRHSTSLTIETAIKQSTMIALSVDGNPLNVDHGGPIRNIVPGRYFYKSVKWLEGIELLTHDRLGFWEAESGYHNEADPWSEQRYMAPSIDRRKAIELIETRDFSNQDLRSIDASDRNLEKLNATHALLRDANFARTNLTGANFTKANLSNAHFHNANLRDAAFVDTDIEGADFSGADLRGTDFRGSSLIGASFVSTNDGEPLAAIIDESTVLPDETLAPLFPAQLEFVKQKLGRS